MADFSWLPGWVIICLFVIMGLFAFTLLCMPFAVFGLKPRLREVEFQLEELRAELQSLTLRLTAPSSDHRIAREYTTPVRDNDITGRDLSVSHTESEQEASDDAEKYFEPATTVRSDQFSYEDGPEYRGRSRQPRRIDTIKSWEQQAPWEEKNRQHPAPNRMQPQPIRQARDELAPRKNTRYDFDEEYSKPRAEPKLRWPPR
ncbi:hypothetical protein [Swingsia samuiensis]|nr:hypothetical protein [Swingsia samuiensis]